MQGRPTKRERIKGLPFSGRVAAVVGDGLGLHSAAWAGGEPFPGPHAQCTANQRMIISHGEIGSQPAAPRTSSFSGPQLYCVTLLPSSGVKRSGAAQCHPCLRKPSMSSPEAALRNLKSLLMKKLSYPQQEREFSPCSPPHVSMGTSDSGGSGKCPTFNEGPDGHCLPFSELNSNTR